MTLANAAYLGIERYANNRVNENWMSASSDDKAAVIRAVYQQVLGNQYVMASERLEGPESLFKRGYLSVRELVRQVAKSGLYRKRFFESSNPYRFIELNFKHLLGRAPQNKAEMLHHFTILQEQGYDAEIDSYLDSAEYQDRFGEEGVPYLHGWNYSVGQQGLQFSYMLQLVRGTAASIKGDITKNQFRLNPSVHAEAPLPVVSPMASPARAWVPARRVAPTAWRSPASTTTACTSAAIGCASSPSTSCWPTSNRSTAKAAGSPASPRSIDRILFPTVTPVAR
jgi:phycoerythrin-associated linker protein